ncbi:MAG: alpha/beta fold hydrolase, partial [archaeon]
DDYSIESIENENNYSLKEGCEAISSLREYYSDLNNSISLINYPTNVDFWNNISTKINNIKNNLTDYYLNLLSPNSINHDIILSLLEQTPIVYTENYKYNLTDALLYKLIEQQPEECSLSDIQMNLSNMNFSKIIVNITPTPLNFNFEEQFSRCCVYGNCSECCLECYKNNYPVIFLHGHSFNKALEADYSLDLFDILQGDLEKYGHVSGGILINNLKKDNNLGLTNVSWTFRTSYYFDVFKELDAYNTIQTKNDNIDTYSVRLNEIIKNVKLRTNRDKVVIMAHSMGGLVVRRYLQIFGDNDVDKVILVGTPNHGIDGEISALCPIFGERLECSDMNKNSLLINRLNNQEFGNVKVYNIIGQGCDMDIGDGDGIVSSKNAFLENAENIYVNGTCFKSDKFHTDLLNINKYPEIHKAILNSLKKDNLTLTG